MRIVVTGAGGQLGRELVGVIAAAGHEPVAADRGACDVTVPGAAARLLARIGPDAVVNCAAWTDVDGAERAPDEAYRANALGPRLLAAACAAAGVRLCHVSTDFVFDGDGDEPLDEWAPVRPLSVYGASKLAGEHEVRSLCPDHQIVRTAWLFGQEGPNFVLTVLRLAAQRPELRVVDDQHGSPTWTGHLAPALIGVLERELAGLLHLAGGGHVSWNALAKEIFRQAAIDCAVEAVTSAEMARPAPRPAWSALETEREDSEQLPDWREGLAGYLAARLR